MIHTVFSSVTAPAENLTDEDSARNTTKSQLATIRDKIMATPLNPEVVQNLTLFIDNLNSGGGGGGGGSFVAVRSSSTAEDLESQSFAGQYDTCKYFSSSRYYRCLIESI